MTATRRAVAVGLGVVGAAALAVVLWVAVFRSGGEDAWLEASGTVEATEGRLGFQAAGRIESIGVQEGDRVRRGVELACLDDAEMVARREQATAQAAAARARLEELEHGFRSEEVAQGRAARAAAKERLEDAKRDLERTRRLYEGGAVSREAYDKAMMGLEVARAEFSGAAEQLKLLEAGPRKEQIEAQRAQLAQAEAAIRAIDATLANMTIVAPFDGVVTVRHREPGEIVSPGSAVLTVMNPEDRWVQIYVREDRIGAVHLGQSAVITSDTYSGKEYGGRTTFIASEAEFTPKNVQTTEERVKLVYAVKVRITDDPTYDLKPGMPADVRIQLESQ